MEETISLNEILNTVKKRLVMIVSITMITVMVAGTYSYFFVTPKYQASTQVLVSQAATGASILSSANLFDTDERYIETYNVILKSPYILDQVVEEMNLNTTHRTLNRELAVQQEGNSQVVTITIEDTDPLMAVEKANVTAEVFREEIVTLLNVDNIHVLSAAEIPDSLNPVSPNPELNMAIAMIVGLMAGVGLAFLMEFMDNTIRQEEDITEELGLPLLGSITIMDQEEEQIEEQRNLTGTSKKSSGWKGSDRLGS